MFDSLKNMAGMAGLLKDLPRIKARMEEVKRELANVTVEAETGGGAVRAVVNGHLRVVSIRVEPAMLSTLIDSSSPDDQSMAVDLIVGAVNAAIEKARQRVEQEIAAAARELNLPIPPGAIGGLLG